MTDCTTVNSINARSDVVLERFFLRELKDRLVFSASDRLGKGWRMLRLERPVQRSATQLVMREEDRVLTAEQHERMLGKIYAAPDPGWAADVVAELEFYGIAGFIQLLDSFYAVLITRRRLVGNIHGHDIFAVDGVRYLQVSTGSIPPEAKKLEQRYVKLLADNELMRECFFSYTYDLTRSLQTNMGGRPCSHGESSRSSSDMFTWNSSLLHGGGFLPRLRCRAWALQLIHGFFEQRTRQVSCAPTLVPWAAADAQARHQRMHDWGLMI